MNLKSMMRDARSSHVFKVENVIMEFTEEVAKRMAELGISQSDLARRIGVNPSYITKILRGTSNFTFDSVVKIATELDCEFRCHLHPMGRKSAVSLAGKELKIPAQIARKESAGNLVSSKY